MGTDSLTVRRSTARCRVRPSRASNQNNPSQQIRVRAGSGKRAGPQSERCRSTSTVTDNSLPKRAKDLPSSLILSIETYLASLTFDELGYPLGIALNTTHFLVRLPSLYHDTSRWVARTAGWSSADQRLRAIQEATSLKQARWVRSSLYSRWSARWRG